MLARAGALLAQTRSLRGRVVNKIDARITTDERSRVLRLLQYTRNDFLVTAGPLTEAERNFRPGPERWSIGLIAENLRLAEHGLLSRVERALESAANPDWESAIGGKNALVEKILLDRDLPRDAPERVVPAGTLGEGS